MWKKTRVVFMLILLLLVLCLLLARYRGALPVSVFAAPEISAAQAILIDGNTGEVLYEKEAEKKAYPASITKIVTALLTIETAEAYHSDLDQKVKAPQSAVGAEGSSIYLAAGEDVSLRDLLYGLMLRSGNDAAAALAEVIGGNQEHFAAWMNERMKQAGCTGTHFTNPSGLFDENHYTTAKDMALISMEAMQNSTFREIVKASSWQASREEGKYNTFYNKNKTVYQYEGGVGIKIGYTEKSGRTLVAAAERDGRLLICVVLSAPDWFSDAYALMDYGFERR